MSFAWWPERSLPLKRADHSFVIEDGNRLIQRGQPGAIGKELPHGDCLLAVLREFRPDFRNAGFEREIVLLQAVQHARGGEPFARRPEKNKRRACPRFGLLPVAKTCGEIQYLAAATPYRDRCPEFIMGGKIFLKSGFYPFEIHNRCRMGSRSASPFANSRNFLSMVKLVSRCAWASG